MNLTNTVVQENGTQIYEFQRFKYFFHLNDWFLGSNLVRSESVDFHSDQIPWSINILEINSNQEIQ